MNTALLRQEKIILIKPISVRTEYGSFHNEWEEAGSYRAGILTQSMNRIMNNDEIQFPQQKTFIVRHYVPVKEGDRIKWDDKLWTVESIIKNKYYNDIEIYVDKVEE